MANQYRDRARDVASRRYERDPYESEGRYSREPFQDRGAALWRDEFGLRSAGPAFEPYGRGSQFITDEWRSATNGYFGTDGGPDFGRAYETSRSRGFLDRDYSPGNEARSQEYGTRGFYGEEDRGFARFESDRYRGTHRGRGPKGYERSDERVRDAVCERLSDDPYIDASEITVTVASGVVRLIGSVDSRQEKYEVEELVANCGGVKDVDNQLRVQTRQEAQRESYATTNAPLGGNVTSRGRH